MVNRCGEQEVVCELIFDNIGEFREEGVLTVAQNVV